MPRKGEPMSPELREKMRAGQEARMEARIAARIAAREAEATVMPYVREEPYANKSSAASPDPLKDLAALIVKATSKDAEEAKILDQFTALLSRIDFKKHPELRDHPAMQGLIEKAFDREIDAGQPSERVAPGTLRGEGLNAQAVPWTWQHVQFLAEKEPDGMFGLVKFTPERTETVIWNGLQVWFAEGITATYHRLFVNNYMQKRQHEREAARHAQWLFKKGPWDPNVPVELQPTPTQDWLEDEGFRMRSNGDSGMMRLGMGWNPAVDGKRFIPGMGPAPDNVEPIETPVPVT